MQKDTFRIQGQEKLIKQDVKLRTRKQKIEKIHYTKLKIHTDIINKGTGQAQGGKRLFMFVCLNAEWIIYHNIQEAL